MCRRRHDRDEIPSSLAEIFIFTNKLALKRLRQKSATILMQSVTEIINNPKFEKQTSCVLWRVIHDLKAQMVYASLPNRNDYRRKVYHISSNGYPALVKEKKKRNEMATYPELSLLLFWFCFLIECQPVVDRICVYPQTLALIVSQLLISLFLLFFHEASWNFSILLFPIITFLYSCQNNSRYNQRRLGSFFTKHSG